MAGAIGRLRDRMRAGTLKPEQATTVPIQCGTGWGKLLWREPEPTACGALRVVNISHWDLCEIGHHLQRAFQQHTDWPYVTIATGQSWIRERQHVQIDLTASFDRQFAEDMIDLADVVHINGQHGWWFLDRLNLRGKRMIIHHHGTEFRNNYTAMERLEIRAGYGRLCSTPDLTVKTRGRRYSGPTWLPSPIDIEELDRVIPRWKKPEGGPLNLIHAYTVARNKGTDEFVAATEAVQRRGTRLQVGMVNHVSRQQSLWHISQADVYFATLLYGPGVASLEAMAFGVPVLCGCDDRDLKAILQQLGLRRHEELPWIHVTPTTLADRIEQVAHEPAMRAEYARRGRAYVEQYHSLPAVAKRLRTLYSAQEPARGVVVNNAIQLFGR
jgi:glycosyltransferase involved in cell wall biosynthesis